MEKYDLSNFAEKFIDDAQNLLMELENQLLELVHDRTNNKLIEAIFRAMHTLKGNGGMFGFNTISEFTHNLETIYDRIRSGQNALNDTIFEITFASIDHLRDLLSDPQLTNPKLQEQHLNLMNKLRVFVEGKEFSNEEPEEALVSEEKTIESLWYIQFVCSEEIEKRAINIVFIFQDLEKIGACTFFMHKQGTINGLLEKEDLWGILLQTKASYAEIEEVLMFVLDYTKIIKLSDNTQAPEMTSEIIIEDTGNPATDKITSENDTEKEKLEALRAKNKIPRISVGADKLDKLMFLVSELYTTRSELMTATNSRDFSRIKLAAEKIDKLSAQFRNNALSIRLVPLKELTLKFKRLIHDLSLQLNKKIEFEIQGAETELDKNLVDNLADPFMHLIRNCVDHGIETSEVRLSSGKPEIGKIRFVAYQSGNYIFIQISDDGKGIDKEVIKNKAIEKGLVQPNAQLSDKEIYDLIYLPGFSTAGSLTQVSGRGVGMDVVKRVINDLRGSVELDSELGRGTTFTIKLQQTISIIDTLLVRVNNSYYTIILEEVEICQLESHQNIFDSQNSHVKVGGKLLPFISLRQAFSIKGEIPKTERIILIKRPEFNYAIIVDSIIGQYQAVIKPLGTGLKQKEYISGASIMGDGNIAFMLDTYKLYYRIN